MTRRDFVRAAAAAALLPRNAAAALPDLRYFLSVGQSLMNGTNGGTGLTTAQPFSNSTVSGTSFPALVNTTLECPLVPAANQFRSMAGSGNDVVAYNAAVDGQEYAALKKGTTPYANSITNANLMPAAAAAAGRTYTFAAILCMHGEADASTNLDTQGATYLADLIKWREDYQTDLAAISGQTTQIPFFTDQCATRAQRATPVDGLGNPGVSQVQRFVARDNGLWHCVLPLYPYPYSDTVHLTNSGYRIVGETFGKWIYRVLILGNPWTGLIPRRITRAGAVITCQCRLYGGASLVIDTSTVSDKGTGKGFEFFDNSGNPPSISSVSVSGDSAMITLASVPTGGNQRLRYAYTGTAGSGGLGGQSGQAHGNIRNDDSTVGVGSGSNLYDWLQMFDEPIGFPVGGAISSGVLRR